jgi:hypothetical protein
MSELLLVKPPRIYRSQNGTNPRHAEQVIGITLPGSETMMEHGYKPTGQEKEESLRLSDFAAARLAEFYERCRVAKPADRPFYNCHLLAWYITGSVVDLQRYDSYKLAAPSVEVTTLQAGQTYAIATRDGINHSMVGIERPDYSLSVAGDNSSIAVINNVDLLSLYEGVTIKQVTPESASFNV